MLRYIAGRGSDRFNGDRSLPLPHPLEFRWTTSRIPRIINNVSVALRLETVAFRDQERTS
jgi:hypothetical protein